MKIEIHIMTNDLSFESKKRLNTIIERYVLYFDNIDNAYIWINTPIRGLAYRKPLDMIHSDAEMETVLNLLGRLIYGVYT